MEGMSLILDSDVRLFSGLEFQNEIRPLSNAGYEYVLLGVYAGIYSHFRHTRPTTAYPVALERCVVVRPAVATCS